MLLRVMQFAVTHITHPERKKRKRKGIGTAQVLTVQWERPPSAAMHVQREKHHEETESFEPIMSPEQLCHPCMPMQCRGAVRGYSHSSRDLGWSPPIQAHASHPTPRVGCWPARDKHHSPLDVEK